MNHRILIADDDDTLRETLGELLSRLGFGILEAQDGPTALDLFRKENPAFTILDFHMPGMTGLEVLETLRREAQEEGGPEFPLLQLDTPGHVGPRSPFIFLSAEADQREQDAAMAAGAFRFLNKPISVENLFASVTDLMQVFLPDIARREGGTFGFSFSFTYETVEDGGYFDETGETSFALIPIDEVRLPVPFDSILPNLFSSFFLTPEGGEENREGSEAGDTDDASVDLGDIDLEIDIEGIELDEDDADDTEFDRPPRPRS